MVLHHCSLEFAWSSCGTRWAWNLSFKQNELRSRGFSVSFVARTYAVYNGSKIILAIVGPLGLSVLILAIVSSSVISSSWISRLHKLHVPHVKCSGPSSDPMWVRIVGCPGRSALTLSLDVRDYKQWHPHVTWQPQQQTTHSLGSWCVFSRPCRPFWRHGSVLWC